MTLTALWSNVIRLKEGLFSTMHMYIIKSPLYNVFVTIFKTLLADDFIFYLGTFITQITKLFVVSK